MSDNRIEIDFDADPEPFPANPTPANAATSNPNRIVITSEDVRFDPPPPEQTAFRPYTAGPGAGTLSKKSVGGAAASNIGQALLAGLIGGGLAWAICEPFTHDNGTAVDLTTMLVQDAASFGVVGGLIGCCIGAAEGVTSGAYEKALRSGGIGLAIGAIGGAIGGVVGQLAYSSMLAGTHTSMGTEIVARTVGWAILGIFIGLGQGVGRGSGRRVSNGLIGGLIGGILAGSTFDIIGAAAHTGTISRAVSLCLLGVASGAAIGLVDEVRKQAWITVTGGQLAGKQFILYDARTRIGSSQKCEITLIKDPHVMPEHVVIENNGNTHILRSLQGPALINGSPVNNARLIGGNVIQLGASSLLFEEKRIA